MNFVLSALTQMLVGMCLPGLIIPAFSQRPIRINLGTVAAEGSPWHDALLQMGQEWRNISAGRVALRIYPSGVLGDEHEMLKKVRIGQLQAVALSGAGLPRADRGISCLQIPMLIESYDEFDYVRERIAPRLEARLREKGYIVLNWGDAGWVHFFTKEPARTLDDIRKMKLFTSAGDPETEKLMKEVGLNPVPLAVTDLILALQTGLIEAFDIPPLFAMLNQSFGLAKNMIDVKWAALVVATLISKRGWERIPETLRPAMLEAARRVTDQRRAEIRKMGDDAVVEMQKRGLKVFNADSTVLTGWRSEVEAAYPKLRGRLVPEDLFDEVVRLRDEFRASRTDKETRIDPASHRNSAAYRRTLPPPRSPEITDVFLKAKKIEQTNLKALRLGAR